MITHRPKARSSDPGAEPTSGQSTAPRTAGLQRPSLGFLISNRKGLIADGLRFLAAGGLNTLLTLGVYQLCLFFLSPRLSYVVAWLVGILFVVIIYPERVFPGGRSDARTRIELGLTYVGVFFFGLAILHSLESLTHEARLSILIVVCVTTIANLIIGRLLLRR